MCETFLHALVVVNKGFSSSWMMTNPRKSQDAICEGLDLNDNRVVNIHLVKYIDPLHPHLEVELEALEDWRFDQEYVLLK